MVFRAQPAPPRHVLAGGEIEAALSLFEFPAFGDDTSAGGQGAEFAGHYRALRNGGFLQFSGEDGDFLSTMPAAPEFSLAFTAAHTWLLVSKVKNRHYAKKAVSGQRPTENPNASIIR